MTPTYSMRGAARGATCNSSRSAAAKGASPPLDISPKAIDAVKARFAASDLKHIVSTHEADVLRTPFQAGTFDLAWSIHTLHIIADPVAGVRDWPAW